MRCPDCGFDNPDGMKFCGECGTALKNRCPQCGFDNPPRFKFCGECGTPLGTRTPAVNPVPISPPAVNFVPISPPPIDTPIIPVPPVASQPGLPMPPAQPAPMVLRPPEIKPAVPPPLPDPPSAPQTPAGLPSSADLPAPHVAYRQLTAMFCNLVEASSALKRLSEEEVKKIAWTYQAACADAIQSAGGHLVQYIDNGILAYFGYPQAQPDEVWRAVRTGLAIVKVLATLHTRLGQYGDMRFAVRIGIHTGTVVLDAAGNGHHQQFGSGTTPYLAAQLQALAPPDTVLISAATVQRLQGKIACQEMGEYTLEGSAQAVAVYRALLEPETAPGPQAAKEAAIKKPSPAERETDMNSLRARWAEVCETNIQESRMGQEKQSAWRLFRRRSETT